MSDYDEDYSESENEFNSSSDSEDEEEEEPEQVKKDTPTIVLQDSDSEDEESENEDVDVVPEDNDEIEDDSDVDLEDDEEPLEENIEICEKYLTRMSKMGMTLEMELGITGGEEDGVDNSDVDNSLLYTQPEDVYKVYAALSKISPNFTIAASFGNVHGVYKPGNVKLTPVILKNSQEYIKAKAGISEANPVNFVFHGGSGSTNAEIREAISYGVIKMNIDTDTQWAMWDGVRAFEAANRPYLQGQIGNPDGAEKPNKKYYDPRVWLRKGEESLIARLQVAFEDLNAINSL